MVDTDKKTADVSVIIPVYNQAQYVAEAIDSALAQTVSKVEIIVVDDGSTDGTAAIVQQYRPHVQYVYQDNQGLASARNTGIRCALAPLVALLDSDDIWEPEYLAEMLAIAKQETETAVFYCEVHYIDSNGQPLPQAGHNPIISPEQMYHTLLRANFLIPSTVLMRREAALAVGLFDVSFRRLQDWEMWIRLLRQGYQFRGIPKRLIRYRIHGDSLSTDPDSGQRAAMALAIKHFGPDDGNYNEWPEDKRRMYGGIYRYHALTTSLLRVNDWSACARYLGLALLVDPSLAEDLDLFYELALGTQPVGQRGQFTSLNLDHNEQMITALLSQMFAEIPEVASISGTVYSYAHYALGLLYYGKQQPTQARRHLWRSFAYHPRQAGDRQWCIIFLKSLLPAYLVNFLRVRKLNWLHVWRGN